MGRIFLDKLLCCSIAFTIFPVSNMFTKRVVGIVRSCGARIAVKSVHTEAKIAALGLELPAPAVPKGNFVNYLVIGNMAYLSGHLPQVSLAAWVL